MAADFKLLHDAHILVVEDDADINSVVCEYLSNHGACCISAYSGTEAQLVLKNEKFDLIISDLMLPGTAGESIVSQQRHSGDNTPVIVISARNTADDMIDLLSMGADDYVAKPFDLGVLAARAEAKLRKKALISSASAADKNDLSQSHNFSHAATFGKWIIDSDAMTLSVIDYENNHA